LTPPLARVARAFDLDDLGVATTHDADTETTPW
jgi:hypothetical protein